jgi:2-polyprenyl-3-methyl-5-hydroxy-6-metoxy-1,4-benzoquinol methylase
MVSQSNLEATMELRSQPVFGRYLDTKILRLLAHDRNRMTEDQIIARAQIPATDGINTCTDEDFVKFTGKAGSYFRWKGKTVLDVGCGTGDLAVHLAMRGARSVVGVDADRERITVARSAAANLGIANIDFVQSSFHDWGTAEQFDYVISYEALDHIPDTTATLRKMAALTKDEGRIINFASGFWLGPIGADHADSFMRLTIPWRQLLFNQEALFAVRREKYRPTDPATGFEDIRGGLTQYTLSEYKQAILDSGLQVIAWETNYQLKTRFRGLLYPLSTAISSVPRIGEYAVFSSFGVFAKRLRHEQPSHSSESSVTTMNRRADS